MSQVTITEARDDRTTLTPSSPLLANGYSSSTSSTYLTASSSSIQDDHFSISINTQTKFKRNYQMAIKQYLNRNFQRAWDITSLLVSDILDSSSLNSLDTELTLKIFKLYLSLVDLILKEITFTRLTEVSTTKEDLKFPRITEDQILSSQIVNGFLNGNLPEQIKKVSSNNYQSIDPELLLMCFMIELSNGYSLVGLRTQVEEYLTQVIILPNGKSLRSGEAGLNDIKILEFYLFYVLKKTNELSYSKQLIAKLFAYDNNKAIDFLEKLQKINEAETLNEKDDEIKENFESLPVTTMNGKMKKKKRLKPKKKVEKKELKPTDIGNQLTPVSRTNSILSNFDNFRRQLFSYYDKNSMLIKSGFLLAFLVSLLISLGSKKLGRTKLIRLRQFISWLLEKFNQTLQMAVKTSYL